VINRADLGDRKTEAFCEEHRIPVLLRIPFDRRIAEAYSRGQPLIDAFPEYRDRLSDLFATCRSLADAGRKEVR